LKKEFLIEGEIIHIGTSIGIAEYPSVAKNRSLLMQHADVAMYKSKRNKLPYHVFAFSDESDVA
ncbi:MAG: diguanylate cyclase, partial [Gammaproteobacteria bacterium]